MRSRLLRFMSIAALAAVLFACSREPEPREEGLLHYVPADTPYAFVVSRQLPEKLRERMGNQYAAQLASQRAAFASMRAQIEGSADGAMLAQRTGALFDVLDALFAEFEGRDTAAALRELGLDPVARSAFYGIGPLPALRVEILDANALNAMLDRVEKRAGVAAQRAESAGQNYRRIDLGVADVVLAVTEHHLVAGLLADARFEQDLPLLLGQREPAKNLADAGDMQRMIERHQFTGYGEGFIRIDELVAILLGEGSADSHAVMQALGVDAIPVSSGCMQLTRELVAGMPRMVVGVRAAEDDRLAVRGVWESTPEVARYLQKLAAPVPGIGAVHDGLLAFGMGLDLPQLRNAIDALLRKVIASEAGCEWVDRERLEAITPQLNLALGPMTAGIKGFNLQIEDFVYDPQSMQPVDVSAGLLAAVDDPRGVFALGAMLNPALATLQIPDDGSFVELPRELALDAPAPPLKVAIKDRALLLLAGSASAKLANSLTSAVPVTPAPLFAIDYGIHKLVERLDKVMEGAASMLEQRGETELAAEAREQFATFRVQAQFFDRLRILVHASDQGLVMDEEMQLR